MKKIKRFILSPLNILYKISPELTLKIIFRIKLGYKLNLSEPRNFNEKIQWIKLNYHNDLMPICADKYTVREYVRKCGCGEILNELIWHGYKPEEIPFDDLPEKFVIKVTHGSGFNIICKNKEKLDRKKTIKLLNKWLKKKFIPYYGEWFYGKIKPSIIIEKFLSEDGESIPADYKMFYFNNYKGKKDVAFTVVDTDRFIKHKRIVYDREWNKLVNTKVSFPYDDKNDFDKPLKYNDMIEYAKKLARPFPHARIDFYVINNKVYFGEITFTSDAGFGKIEPPSFNLCMGDWIKLPSSINEKIKG